MQAHFDETKSAKSETVVLEKNQFLSELIKTYTDYRKKSKRVFTG